MHPSSICTSFHVIIILNSVFCFLFLDYSWFLLLWRLRAQLNPRKKHSDQRNDDNLRPPEELERDAEAELAAIQRERLDNPALQATRFLWVDYIPSCFAFEIVEMQRRILFIGVLPLLGDGALRCCIGLLLSLLVAIFLRETSPFLRGSTK